MENKDIRLYARNTLQGKWTTPVLVTLIYLIISGGLSAIPFLGSLASLLLSGAFMLGISRLYLTLIRDGQPMIDQLFSGFDASFVRAMVLYILQGLATLLGLILLIVPGIMIAIRYSMTYYILADHPELSEMQIMEKSRRMMYGHKMRFFMLGLSFIGWFLLCILTAFIGLLWLIPYIQTSTAKFYEDLKENHEEFQGPLPIL